MGLIIIPGRIPFEALELKKKNCDVIRQPFDGNQTTAIARRREEGEFLAPITTKLRWLLACKCSVPYCWLV